ncbi:MAG: T9SS type A sorting domain-containing protein [Bacteroidetes bacterium]|nr:T9SS type A sorting domain-containing protein [Bacteroidota bacterium]MBK7969359.1 T9SS type A sorting domain-containing protein [Bacteroidota bacterium]MBK8415455.1 T9SS type A sorting domain-containing protein [Bacteroidota bacterium]MBK8875169.1 T9SS type A sorting domain-containing protein [Bacteroidota bacterium]MBK9047467.1 T9SS type A sorting domain-containing protein [Bacteroidota bacterium]
MKIKSTFISLIFVFAMLTCFVKPASGSNDYGITAIIQPTCSAAVSGTLHPVIVVITNFGTTSQTSIPVSYTVSGGIPTTATYNGYLAPGTSDTFDISVAGFIVPNGPYTFCAYNEGDSTPANDTTCISCNGSPMSINDHQDNSNNGIIIYPNPTAGTFSLKMMDKLVYNTSIVITDIFGKVVWTSDYIKPEFNIDITNEPNGVYLINLISTSSISNSKLVLAK